MYFKRVSPGNIICYFIRRMQKTDVDEAWELGFVLVNRVYEEHSTKSKIVTRHKGLLLSTARYRSSCSQLTSGYFTSGLLYWFCFACLEHRDLCIVTKHWPVSKSRFIVDKIMLQGPLASHKTLYTMCVPFVFCVVTMIMNLWDRLVS